MATDNNLVKFPVYGAGGSASLDPRSDSGSDSGSDTGNLRRLPEQLAQVVLYVDRHGAVLSCDSSLGDDVFPGLGTGEGASPHELIHPGCKGGCKFEAIWETEFAKLATQSIVESELEDSDFKRVLRIHIMRTTSITQCPSFAVAHIADITNGRDAVRTLQETHRTLRAKHSIQDTQLTEALAKVNDDHERMAELDERLRFLSSHLIRAQEQERERISRDLHDGPGQRLSMARYMIEQALERLETNGGPDVAVELLTNTRDQLAASIREIRDVVRGLKHSVLKELGVVSALELLVREFRLSYNEIEFSLDADGCNAPVSYEVSVAMYRIAQEAVSNATRHSGGSHVHIGLYQTLTQTYLQIADDGAGFDYVPYAKASAGQTGYGLASMRERTRAVGGVFDVESKPGEGTTITVVWPIDPS
jgi:signal transduction histidine kinase